ncbi:MAG: ABC transporter permease [Longimicrobiales bacterium]
MKGLHWYIARHYLGAGRGRGLLSLITWIALGGVTVGVTALVVVTAVMTGMQEDLKGKILESSAHVLVLEHGSTLRLSDWPRVVESILVEENATAAAPFVLSQVSLVITRDGQRYSQPANLYGILVDTAATPATDMERDILQGALDLEPPESGANPILLGSGLANRMGLFPGDTVVIVALENLRSDPFGGLSPALRQFEVTGTFTTGMYDYDHDNVYTTLDAAQELLGLAEGNVVSGIGVRTTDPDLANVVGDALQSRLGFPYYVESWETRNRALFSALRLEKLAMGLILFLIVLVAAFNIVSTLVMVVADRTREIGILKAMGMTRAGILRVFVLQGAWIGIIGTVVGTALGVFLGWLLGTYELIKIPPDVYFVDHLPVSMRLTDILKIVGASVVVSFAATVYPAVQASRLEPVDAIRHD